MKTLLLSLIFSLSINYFSLFFTFQIYSLFSLLVHIIIILFPFFILLSFFIIRFYHLNFIYTFCEKFEFWKLSIIKIQRKRRFYYYYVASSNDRQQPFISK
uniref:Transmembrane protein n=1 Tax=Cacopsylla melanoneura TaxID=428564 RepID=A0A8D8Q7M8_9HEMI